MTETQKPEPTIELVARKRARIRNAYLQFVIDAREEGEEFVAFGPVLSADLDTLWYRIKYDHRPGIDLVIEGEGDQVDLSWHDLAGNLCRDRFLGFHSSYDAEVHHAALTARLRELADD